MIKTGLLKFEMDRTLYKRGKLKEKNELFEIDFKAASAVENHRTVKKKSGSYKLHIITNGLSVKGAIISKDINIMFLKINNIILKKINVTGKTNFVIRIKRLSLMDFPKNSVLNVEFDNGTKLIYENSDSVFLSIPFGNGLLEKKLEDGFSLSKKGTIDDSKKDLEQKRDNYLNLYSRVKDAFDEVIGSAFFLTYGTLLGHTREGDFIPNDDDFDAGYISLKSSPEEVKKETLDIIRKLLNLGFNISVNKVGRLFRIYDGTKIHLDVMPVWFENEWNVAYGGASVKSSVDDYLPITSGLLRNREVYIPKNPEVFLSGYYGKNWMVPDPGYISDYTQTGKVLLKNYTRYLITPLEYKRFCRVIKADELKNPNLGKFNARALNVKL
jgi:hypothetical protein